MPLAFKLCLTLLLLVAVAEGQEPMTPAVQVPTRPRPHRVVRPQPHVDDPWYPDPPAEGAVTPRPPQPSTPPPAATVPVAVPAVTPVSQPARAQQPAVEDLGPATPPQVAYRNGQLTVRAINSTLESVLNAIRNKAGIQFEGLEGGASERVVISMGPLPEGEVLATILGGSRFDFVVVERPDSPGVVQRVLLSPRKGSLPATAQAPGTQPAPRTAGGEDEENPDEGSAEPESPQDTPVRPPIVQGQPQMQINPQPQPPQQQPTQQPGSPKTPEQLLEELKQMQQRQQQQQQQQPEPPRQPPL